MEELQSRFRKVPGTVAMISSRGGQIMIEWTTTLPARAGEYESLLSAMSGAILSLSLYAPKMEETGLTFIATIRESRNLSETITAYDIPGSDISSFLSNTKMALGTFTDYLRDLLRALSGQMSTVILNGWITVGGSDSRTFPRLKTP